MTVGIFIMALMVVATYFLQAVVLVPALIGLAGLVIAGFGASQRFERRR